MNYIESSLNSWDEVVGIFDAVDYDVDYSTITLYIPSLGRRLSFSIPTSQIKLNKNLIGKKIGLFKLGYENKKYCIREIKEDKNG